MKKSVKTKTVDQDDLKKMNPEQKDFRSNLKRASSSAGDASRSRSGSIENPPNPSKDQKHKEPSTQIEKPKRTPEPEPVTEPVRLVRRFLYNIYFKGEATGSRTGS